MSKNIFIVSSTLRHGGNSELLAEEFAKGAEEAGHKIVKVNLKNINLNYCIGCLSCQKTKKCVIKDDMNALYDTAQSADILVFATPIYYYSICGQLKTFLDRLNPLYSRDNNFKEVYLLCTSAENDKSAMDGAIKDIQGWIDCFDDVRLKGVVYGIGAENAGDIKKQSAIKDAYNMGKSIK